MRFQELDGKDQRKMQTQTLRVNVPLPSPHRQSHLHFPDFDVLITQYVKQSIQNLRKENQHVNIRHGIQGRDLKHKYNLYFKFIPVSGHFGLRRNNLVTCTNSIY